MTAITAPRDFLPKALVRQTAGQRPLTRALIYAGLIFFTLLWLAPVYSALITAVRTMSDIQVNGFWSIPREITLQNFVTAWNEGRVSIYAGNSFIITFPALAGMLLLSSLSAYALARYQFPGNRLLYFTFVGGMLLPFQVLMLPVFRLTNAIGLYDTYAGIILFHIAFQLGFCTFVLRNFMRGVPNEIFEAARVDGCDEFRSYWQIMLPLTKPAFAALATLEFTWIFNDYLWAIVLLRRDALKPVTAGAGHIARSIYHRLAAVGRWFADCHSADGDCLSVLATLLHCRVNLGEQ